ncbi:hypothetical protein DAI22_05g018500 [Oryza sativa Japonica Group]|nr:hypothetical protein DAI22_05g018500 [Oryza sativa Japonica Group]KAF2928918.1 hypothetical protein DAI22_05g018500 [Oryza sativa Japonica Group]
MRKNLEKAVGGGRPDAKLQSMPMQTTDKTDAVKSMLSGENSEGSDGSKSSDTVEWDPWDPPHPPCPTLPPTASLMSQVEMVKQHHFQVLAVLAASRATNIIAPDRTPQEVRRKFAEICSELADILEKDSVRRFLNLYRRNMRIMGWGLVITSQTMDFIVSFNALRCAKVVLEGKAPKLCQIRANPNYMTSYGYFPLHKAAEKFSVDMIKLLLCYGASANLRTSGQKVIEGLLPLHVAIENTCMHKYLEDNLLTDRKLKQVDLDFIYKLIHLLCLPEMKIFLDTTRLLADNTDNIVDELWNYIKEGRLVHAAILLLAAQRKIRTCASSNRNISCNLNGFDIIRDRVMGSIVSIEREGRGLTSGKNSKAHKQLEEKRKFFHNSLMLIFVISKTGEALDEYIQSHSEVSHQEVLEGVSSILDDHGFAPTGKGISIGDLECRPYDCNASNSVPKCNYEDSGTTKAVGESPNLNVKAKKAVGKQIQSRRELEQTRKMFFPHWRSLLTSRYTVKVFPFYAHMMERDHVSNLHMAGGTENGLKDKWCSPVGVSLLGKPPQLTSTSYQSRTRRLFGTAALTLLKTLKRA